MDNIYFDTTIIKKVVVEPKYLTTQVDDYILKVLKKKYEGKCIHEGFVKEDTIEIEKKSAGLLYGSHFTGEITYTVLFKATVCNPVCGNIIEFEVKTKNPMCLGGILGPMEIVVPKEMVDNQAELKILNSYQIGDKIKVEVVKSRYFPNGTNIRVIGKLISGESVKNNKNNKKDDDKNFVSSYVGENNVIDDEDIPSNVLKNVETSDIEDASEDEDVSEAGDEESVESSDDDIELSDTESENEVVEIKNPNIEEEEESEDDNYDEVVEDDVSDEDEGDEYD